MCARTHTYIHDKHSGLDLCDRALLCLSPRDMPGPGARITLPGTTTKRAEATPTILLTGTMKTGPGTAWKPGARLLQARTGMCVVLETWTSASVWMRCLDRQTVEVRRPDRQTVEVRRPDRQTVEVRRQGTENLGDAE